MTIKDIARLCGVSVSTVSRVLNQHPDVSDPIREKVLAVVEEYHYVPNNSARNLVRAKNDSVGVIVRGVGNLFFTDLLHVISRELHKQGMAMILRQIGTGDNEIQAGAELEREKRLKGLLFLGGRFDYGPEELRVIQVPFVSCTSANRFGTLSEEASVSIDDRQAAREAVDHLIRLGHRSIAALVPGVSDRSISELRFDGYRAALADHGITWDPELLAETGDFSMEAAYRGTMELLDRNKAFTGLFVLSDTMAMAAMKAILDRGLRVPEDISVIGIDGLRLSEYTVPTLTTMVQPTEELGTAAVELLMEMLRGGSPAHRTVAVRLRPGASAAPLMK